VLFSRAANFIPVQATEFIAFAKKQDDFIARKTKLLGLSITSLYSQIA
jgi:peroxiredoxin (alkyl hydroperoxide reductase subunit C)